MLAAQRVEVIETVEEQVAKLQRELNEKTTAMSTLHKHLSRMREKEAAALDGKKLAEIQMKEMQRNELELQLRVVAAEAMTSAADEARERLEAEALHNSMAMAKEAKIAELDAAALEARNEKLRKSVAQLAGRIGGGRSSKRSADEVAAMPRESKQQRDNYRSAKHRMVTKIASAVAEAKSQPQMIASALARAGVLTTVVKASKEGQNILFNHGIQLAQSLEEVWDVDSREAAPTASASGVPEPHSSLPCITNINT